jgi:hypothetical protein
MGRFGDRQLRESAPGYATQIAAISYTRSQPVLRVRGAAAL